MSRSRNRVSLSSRMMAVSAALTALFLLGPSARAHFLWLSADREQGETVVHAFLSELPVPDLPMFMKYIEASTYSAEGRELTADRGEETFIIRMSGETPRAVDGVCDLGVMTKRGSTFRLQYTARVQLAPIPAGEPESGDGLRVRLVEGSGDGPLVLVTFDGKPAAGAEVTAMLDDGSDRKLIADDRGRVDCEGVAEGRTGLLVKWPDGTPGELDGKPFDETRHYATLTVASPDVAEKAAGARTGLEAATDRSIALIPEPINSFGGAVLGDHLYVYSGHTGTTHRYHTGTTNPHFYRIDLNDPTRWEELPCGPDLQGVTLVSDGRALYRAGGMKARNSEGEPHDLISVADVARFDPETGTWTDLPPMPEPRSTHDAAVLDGHLYVVGGWSMPGGDSADAFFLGDAMRLELADPSSGWEQLPDPPGTRRALAVAAHDGKIVMVGGLTEGSGTVRNVDIFDPATGSWSSGPELPGEPIQGFAPSAFSVGGRLFASGGNGTVYRLTESGASWKAVAELAVPRITHRLLPGIHDDVLIVGGNFAGVPVRFVESIPTDGGTGESRLLAWSAELPGPALQSRAFGVVGNRVVVAGGNRSPNPHAFEAENLAVESFRILPDGSAAEPIAPLPEPRQSGVIVPVREGRRSTGYLLGGIGQDGEVVRTLGEVYRMEADGSGWTRLSAEIPDDRGMFGAAVHDGAVWVFGGSIFDPRPEAPSREMPTEIVRWEPGRDASTFEATGHELPRPRRSFAGATLEGKYYLVGGLGSDQELIDAVDVFDFSTGQWGSIPSPARPRVFADLVELDGILYLGGGFSMGSSGHFEPERSIEAYDPEAGAWKTVMEEAPIESNGLRLAAIGGRLLLFGADMQEQGIARLTIVSPESSRPEGIRAE